MLLETAEGLGEPTVKGAGGEIWNMLQGERDNVCKHLAEVGPLCNCAPVTVVESEPTEEVDRQIEWRHRSEMESHLREIVEAQDRLLDGRYGMCAECGAEIDVGRLLAEPITSLCIGCQRTAEQSTL
jgi:RNA polymerase-binding transcription factor DksA